MVAPGDLQESLPVPGEESVPEKMDEIFFYADALARRNGFYGLKNGHGDTDLRNPNIVFPGDKLVLPDGRLVSVEPGETIWRIATKHYKKDFARMVILKRQLIQLENAQDSSSDTLEKKEFIKRLAITPEMRNLAQTKIP